MNNSGEISVALALVTGSAGFIGFHVSKKLLDEGWVIIGIDNLCRYYDVLLKKSRGEILSIYDKYIAYNSDLETPGFFLNISDIHTRWCLCDKPLANSCKNFAGIDSSYEAPETPEIHFDTTKMSLGEAAEKIVKQLLGFKI